MSCLRFPFFLTSFNPVSFHGPEATPFLRNALKKALEPDYPHAAGKRRELLSRIAAMELIYRKLEECRGKTFDIQVTAASVAVADVAAAAV